MGLYTTLHIVLCYCSYYNMVMHERPHTRQKKMRRCQRPKCINLGETLKAMPSVRTEKVEELRQSIDEGEYYVESDKLAKKVVDEALSDIVVNKS